MNLKILNSQYSTLNKAVVKDMKKEVGLRQYVKMPRKPKKYTSLEDMNKKSAEPLQRHQKS